MSHGIILICVFVGTFLGTAIPLVLGGLSWYGYQRIIKKRSKYDIVMSL